MKISFFLSFLLFFSTISKNAIAQEQVTPIHQVIYLIFNEDYHQAEQILDSLMQATPDNPESFFYYSLIPWRQSAFVEDIKNFDKLTQRRLEKCIEVAEKLLEIEPENAVAYFYRGGAHGYLGSMYARQKRWLKTGYHAWKGTSDLEKAAELDPEMHDTYYGLGLYHVMAAHQSGIVRFIQKLLPIPNGDARKGLEYLQLAIQKGNYAPVPARSALAFAYLHFETDYQKTLDTLAPILKIHPTSTDLLIMQINALFNREFVQPANSWKEILFYLDNFEKLAVHRKMQLSDWWHSKLQFIRGYAYYSLGQYEQAEKIIAQYNAQQKSDDENYLLGVGYLTQGKMTELQGMRNSAIEYYHKAQKCREMGNLKEIAEHLQENPFNGENEQTRILGIFTELPERP